MDDLQRVTALLYMVKSMNREGSWCGETHIQKTAYVLQYLLNAPMGFNFIFYKHGPFSFDLRRELVSLHADGLLRLETTQAPYGPKWMLTEAGEYFLAKLESVIAALSGKADFVANRISTRTVADLERLSTALYVSIDGWQRSVRDRAEDLHTLKPHVPKDLAVEAVETLDELSKEIP